MLKDCGRWPADPLILPSPPTELSDSFRHHITIHWKFKHFHTSRGTVFVQKSFELPFPCLQFTFHQSPYCNTREQGEQNVMSHAWGQSSLCRHVIAFQSRGRINQWVTRKSFGGELKCCCSVKFGHFQSFLARSLQRVLAADSSFLAPSSVLIPF